LFSLLVEAAYSFSLIFCEEVDELFEEDILVLGDFEVAEEELFVGFAKFGIVVG
jgi:hypothetical protein